MMRAVAEMTRREHIHTMVSLNSIMIDGTGMCGGCRVIVEDHSEFACVDGPEFDAHKVDFNVLVQRNAMYRDSERESMEEFQQHAAEQLAVVRAGYKSAQAHVSCANVGHQAEAKAAQGGQQ
jgi:hypothetical protein